jgi:hypothetical protein
MTTMLSSQNHNVAQGLAVGDQMQSSGERAPHRYPINEEISMRVTTMMALGLTFGGAAFSEALAADHPTRRVHPRPNKADRSAPAYPASGHRAYSQDSAYPPGGRAISCSQGEFGRDDE